MCRLWSKLAALLRQHIRAKFYNALCKLRFDVSKIIAHFMNVLRNTMRHYKANNERVKGTSEGNNAKMSRLLLVKEHRREVPE